MGIRVRRLVPVGAVLLAVGILFAGCSRADQTMLENLADLEGRSLDELSRARIAELRRDIQRYQSRVNEAVAALAGSATARRMLAIEYINNGMFAEALQELEEAAAVQTENPQLFYYAGVAAGRAAKAVFDEAQRLGLLERAEWMYRRAVALRSDYPEAWYGLAVLYVFELEQAQEGLEAARELRRIEPRHMEGRFVEARALVLLDRIEEAVQMYEAIARDANTSEQREAARRNVTTLLQGAR